MTETVISDEMRERASQKAKFNILFVSDGDSRLSHLRGELAVNTFSKFYGRIADITYMTAPASRLAGLNADTLGDVNVIWMDNIRGFAPINAMAKLQEDLMEAVDAGWQEKAKKIEDEDERIKYIDGIISQRRDKCRIIYAIDEFIWEAPIGRACDIQTVQLVETAMSFSDTIVTPNADLAEAMVHFKFLSEKSEIIVIPSASNTTFFQLFRNYMRTGRASVESLREKPNVLVKGLVIPENVQRFIFENKKKMNITICTVGELNPQVSGEVYKGSVSHIKHWADPQVTNRTLTDTYAIERDSAFDVVILTKPEELQGEMYELTSGDEDILFAIHTGSIPISGSADVGYDEDHLSNASGMTFGKDTTAKTIKKMVESVTAIPVKFNEVYGKCRNAVERRIVNDASVMGRYYTALLGKEEAEMRKAVAAEENEKSKSDEKTSDDNVVAVDFQKGNV